MPQAKKQKVVDPANDDDVFELADKYWSPAKSARELAAFDVNLVRDIYLNHIRASNFHPKRILAFELSQYLECYLWPNYSPETSCLEYVLSIVTMVNQKFRERVAAWQAFKNKPQHFPEFFRNVTRIMINEKDSVNWNERAALLVFFTHCVNSIETDLIREQVQKYMSLSIWTSLTETRRNEEFKAVPKLKKFWNALQKKDAKLDAAALQQATFERTFMYNLITDFFNVTKLVPLPDQVPRLDRKLQLVVKYCERFLELLIDIEALLPTRRFFNALLDDTRVIVNCRKCNVSQRHDEGKLFNQLLEMLVFYARFEIDDQAGEALTDQEMIARHYNKIVQLQKLAWQHFPEQLRKFCLGNVANIDTHDVLVSHFGKLADDDLKRLVFMISSTFCD